ncbi:hypothetical protein E3N88_00332 [Mikania micrantha]|uniref:Uncharacterized protein n=1 Tax=Mikania micrantha TaxID=192012 RepID=A0A5N6PZI9_9ASTR|nr:hypothetical protein E3N88_00332 [Mikania micrantha]
MVVRESTWSALSSSCPKLPCLGLALPCLHGRARRIYGRAWASTTMHGPTLPACTVVQGLCTVVLVQHCHAWPWHCLCWVRSRAALPVQDFARPFIFFFKKNPVTSIPPHYHNFKASYLSHFSTKFDVLVVQTTMRTRGTQYYNRSEQKRARTTADLERRAGAVVSSTLLDLWSSILLVVDEISYVHALQKNRTWNHLKPLRIEFLGRMRRHVCRVGMP